MRALKNSRLAPVLRFVVLVIVAPWLLLAGAYAIAYLAKRRARGKSLGV